MVTLTLDERDEAVLEQLAQGDHEVADLARETQCSTTYLRTRLPALADNALVERRDDDRYALTEDGRRALAGTAAGEMDDRLDTPRAVEQRLESLDLRADREAAVRSAVAELTTRGEVTAVGLVDACYSEHPAGYASGDAWWRDCVRDALADLPQIRSLDDSDSGPDSDTGSDPDGDRARDATENPVENGGERWRYVPDGDASPS